MKKLKNLYDFKYSIFCSKEKLCINTDINKSENITKSCKDLIEKNITG